MPDWNIYDFSQFPAILWKLKNLQSLKDKNPEKYKELHHSLETLLHAL